MSKTKFYAEESQYEQDIAPYRKKAKGASTPKAKHKHIYADVLFLEKLDDTSKNEYSREYLGKECSICGKSQLTLFAFNNSEAEKEKMLKCPKRVLTTTEWRERFNC